MQSTFCNSARTGVSTHWHEMFGTTDWQCRTEGDIQDKSEFHHDNGRSSDRENTIRVDEVV